MRFRIVMIWDLVVFIMRDSGNGVVKNQYPVTKSEKSFHFDLTQVANIFLDPYSHLPFLTIPFFLIPASFAGSPKMRESGTSLAHFLKRLFGIRISG